MEPPNHNLPPTSFLDLNIEDRGHHHLFNLNLDQTFSSNFMNIPSQDQGQFYFREPQRNQVQEADHHKITIVSSDGSRDHHPPRAAESKSDHHHQNDLKLSIWKSTTHEDTNYDHEKSSHVSTENMDSVKWVSSKMRMMRKMIMNPDQTSTDDHTPMNFAHKFDQAVNKDPTSPLGMDHSSSSSSNNINNNAIRVCADCNTTKTPLWRSGPRGPKSLCNACGIRQRKARRAMQAAAAAANGTILATDAASLKISSAKVQRKGKKSKNGNGAALVPQFKKRCKLTASPSRGRKKICFEDLAISISKNSSAFQRVFPQDEKDAAILLMALSYGLVHG